MKNRIIYLNRKWSKIGNEPEGMTQFSEQYRMGLSFELKLAAPYLRFLQIFLLLIPPSEAPEGIGESALQIASS